MTLRPGDKVPAFRAPGSDGQEHSAASLQGKATVITFYPKDETAGCVKQVCALRDVWQDLQEAGVTVLGVSRDTIESHKEFVAHRKLPYTLLSDATGDIHKAFDVGRTFGVTNRVSYLIGPDSVVRAAYKSNLRPEAHAAKMLDAARAL